MTQTLTSLEAAVDHILDTIEGPIVLGIPLGIGKPNPLVNALYRRIKESTTRELNIITALSLEKPVGHSDLERHFLEPLVERVFADYPDLEYVKDSRAGQLPANIHVREFFLKTGDYLGNETAQQNYISTNYTFVARDMAVQGINVLAQAVATREDAGSLRLSLSSNPDVTQEIVARLRASGNPLITIGVVNQAMPFMPNGAEVPGDYFDLLITDPAATHTIFAPPNGKVSTADYAIGLHAASLVRDGGTLQIGIGSLGDAIGQSLILRDRHNESFRSILESVCPDGIGQRELGRFDAGLYGCSEMFVNAFYKLIEAGIIRREVFNDTILQQCINRGQVSVHAIDLRSLQSLLQAGRIQPTLTAEDLAFLKHFGILRSGVEIQGSRLVNQDTACVNDLFDSDSLAIISEHMLGARLKNGIYMTGGFFLGPNDFYQGLRSMPAQELAKIDMTRIDFINQLYGDDALKRAQRGKASFINTTMIVTLLGAAASDGLETGQVVSGVGGQYNFVAMSHALADARLIMLLRATHQTKKGPVSSIVWNYGHTTIPRHLRDVVITEYGVADLRGQSDSEVIKRLIAIADSRFQPDLIAQAKAHGKLEASYQLPERYAQNLPEALEAKLHPWSEAGLLPDFPFGTDLTEDELRMVRAMKKIKHASEHPAELLSMTIKSLWEGREAPKAYLDRLGLTEAHSFKDLLIRRLFSGNV
jgi:acyl-CoA hydrolase